MSVPDDVSGAVVARKKRKGRPLSECKRTVTVSVRLSVREAWGLGGIVPRSPPRSPRRHPHFTSTPDENKTLGRCPKAPPSPGGRGGG